MSTRLRLIPPSHCSTLARRRRDCAFSSVRRCGRAAGGVTEAIDRARRAHMPVELEVDTLEQLEEALAAHAEMILLDNMNSELMRRAVEMTAGRARLEASGGMTLEGAVAAAKAGVDG